MTPKTMTITMATTVASPFCCFTFSPMKSIPSQSVGALEFDVLFHWLGDPRRAEENRSLVAAVVHLHECQRVPHAVRPEARFQGVAHAPRLRVCEGNPD